MRTQPKEDYTKKLYEASIRGCLATLNTLLQRDPLILDRISLTSFSDTPLHIASLLGHVDFTAALLNHKPQLSAELNSQGQSPLHLASARGYVEIVKALLSINTDVCLLPDQHGRIPLHLAAMRGQVEVMQQLISARPNSIRKKLHGSEETVLHLCVKYNHLEALKLLVTWVSDDEFAEFLNSADSDGNTILHLAVIMNQEETIKYLLSIPEVRVEADAFATICRNQPLDFKNMSIPDGIAQSTHVRRPTDQNTTTSHQVLVHSEAQAAQQRSNNWIIKYLDYQGGWMEKARGNLMIVASVIASMAFQAATNPPSGIEDAEPNGCPRGTLFKNHTYELTFHNVTTILDFTHKFSYCGFIASNTISFSVSLGIIFLLICGFPLKSRVSMGILLIAMSATMLFTAAAYIISISVLGKTKDKTIDAIAVIYIMFWVGLLVVIVVFHTINLVIWLLKTLFLILICKAAPRRPVMMLPAAAI